MSLKNGSKEGAKKEETGQSGIGQQAIDKGGQAKDDVTSGNFGNTKDIASKGGQTKDDLISGESSNVKDISGKGGQLKDNVTSEDSNAKTFSGKGGQVKDDITSGNFSNVQNISGKGGSTKYATEQGDAAGATGQSALNKDNINRKSIEDVGERLFGSRPSKGSIGANDDVKKGPIHNVPDQRDAGQESLAGAGSSSNQRGFRREGLNQGSLGQTKYPRGISDDGDGLTRGGSSRVVGDRAAAGGAVAGGGGIGGASLGSRMTDDSVSNELNEQSHISSDVFSAGGPGLTESKALGTNAVNKGASKQPTGKTETGTGKSGQALPIEQTNKNIPGDTRFGGVSDGSIGQYASPAEFSQDALKGNAGPTTSASTIQNDGMTTTASASSTRAVKSLNTSTYKVTVLQEKVQAVTQKCKTQLGVSASEISQRSPTVDAFFDAVAAERLRWMPRDGSRLDCCLRWASRLAYAVDALRESIGAFASGANEAAKLIWGFCILLLEVSYQ